MEVFNEIYKANQEIDRIYKEKYYNEELIIRKNMLALLVELGELANEIRCFKYWSSKPSSSREVILEEFADCMLFLLAFCNYLDVSLDEDFPEPSNYEINKQFIYLYQLCSDLPNNYNKEHIKRIFSNLIKLGRLLLFSNEDIIKACKRKQDILYERLDVLSNY
ncbi:MAG: dUTP diphosphatase [Bacilli bacterium]|nr:dUTP diphosphatase [Bacilli bacterium]